MKIPVAFIATALSLEFEAVREHLNNVRPVAHSQGTIYEVGTIELAGTTWQIVLLESGPNNVRAAMETERAIREFAPSVAFFIGVAGGLKDVEVGDVVAATKVYGFESAKADIEMKPRLEFGEADYRLEQTAKFVRRQKDWLKRILDDSSALRREPNAFVAPIASGEKVVSSTLSPVFTYLKQNCSDALAVEMEGYGFLANARTNIDVAALVVRGISDMVEGKADADASGSQPLAARHAAAFALEVLAKYSEFHVKPELQSTTVNQAATSNIDAVSLLDVMTKLYPQGPRDNKIWERAGGDVSQIDTSYNGRAQWFGALKALEAGGGGRHINLNTLIETALGDFPQNEQLQKFH